MPFRFTLTDLSNMDYEVLTADPIGWDEAVYSIKRSDIYKGIMHEFTTPFKFHCKGGGKQFIDAVYNTQDIDGRIDILVEYDCDGNGNYDTVFNGIIDLSSYVIDNDYTICSIERSDLITKFISRDEINVDLETDTSIGGESITPITAINIPMPSTEIEYVNEWRISDGYQYQAVEHYAGIASSWTAFFTHLAAIKSDDFNSPISWTEYDTLGDTKNVISFQASSLLPILEFNTPGITTPQIVTWEIDFTGTFFDQDTISGGLRQANIYKLNLYYGKKDAGHFNVVTLYDGPGDAGGGYNADPFTENFVIQKTGNITLYPGDELYLVWYISYDTLTGDNTIDVIWTYNESYFKISGITTFKPTIAKSILIHEAFTQVIDAIADSDNNFRSDFYGRTDSQKHTYAADGCGSLIAVTNGLNIREFDRPISVSLRDLYSAMDCQHNIGLGYIDGKIRAEPLSYWYNSSNKIITLPYINNIHIKNDNSRYINKIEIGYNKWQSEFHGGLDDINSKHQYSTIIASVKTIYTKLCNFIASTYTIEFTRRKNKNIDNKEDWRYDNDNFLIAIKRSAYSDYEPEMYADGYSAGANMDGLTTAYNIRLTPKRMLLCHLNVITSGLQIINGLIKFIKGEGNTDFEVEKQDVGCQEDYSGALLSEKGNIEWDDVNAANINPIWLPEIYMFEYPITYQQFNEIKANPTGYIEFYRFENKKMYGYILSMDYSLKTGLTKFQLLKVNNPQ